MATLPVPKDFFQFNQNSTIYTDLIVIRHLNAKIHPLSPPARWGPGTLDSFVVAILPDFDEFLLISSNLTIYTDVTVVRPWNAKINPLSPTCSLRTQGLDSECSGQYCQISMDFFQITSKLDYLYRLSRDPTPTMPVLTLCLPPARWGPKAPDSECNGNIASFQRISSI